MKHESIGIGFTRRNRGRIAAYKKSDACLNHGEPVSLAAGDIRIGGVSKDFEIAMHIRDGRHVTQCIDRTEDKSLNAELQQLAMQFYHDSVCLNVELVWQETRGYSRTRYAFFRISSTLPTHSPPVHSAQVSRFPWQQLAIASILCIVKYLQAPSFKRNTLSATYFDRCGRENWW